MVNWAPMVFSIIGTLFGLIATTLMGMCISKLNGIETHLEKLNGKVFDHIKSSGIHETGLVRLEEQVKQVLEIAKVAHARTDKLEIRIDALP